MTVIEYLGRLPKCLETRRRRQTTMHAVFTRDVAASSMILNTYSRGSLRVEDD